MYMYTCITLLLFAVNREVKVPTNEKNISAYNTMGKNTSKNVQNLLFSVQGAINFIFTLTFNIEKRNTCIYSSEDGKDSMGIYLR